MNGANSNGVVRQLVVSASSVSYKWGFARVCLCLATIMLPILISPRKENKYRYVVAAHLLLIKGQQQKSPDTTAERSS